MEKGKEESEIEGKKGRERERDYPYFILVILNFYMIERKKIIRSGARLGLLIQVYNLRHLQG